MSVVLDGTEKFKCKHEFIPIPNGWFGCCKCQHLRAELELDNKKALLFFPIRLPIATDLTPATVASPKNR